MALDGRLLALAQAIASDIKSLFTGKQDSLASGENLKTINSQSLLGAGDIAIDNVPISVYTAVIYRTFSLTSPVVIGSVITGSFSATYQANQLILNKTTGDLYQVQSDGSVTLFRSFQSNTILLVTVLYGTSSANGYLTAIYTKVSGTVVYTLLSYTGAYNVYYKDGDTDSTVDTKLSMIGSNFSLTTTDKYSIVAAINELVIKKQSIVGKDKADGYAGLTALKLNLRNAANTFTSWFTTDATAARTWTLPDKDGTVAMTSDIVTVPVSSTTVAGTMSAADKTKLDGVATDANNYIHPSSHAPSIIAQDASNRFVTDTKIASWDAKQGALGFTPLDETKVGAANGVAPLGSDSKIPALFLPSYVDDVIEVANYAALPVTGESGKIYITTDTNFEYRWGGSVYVQLVASPGSTDAVPEGSVNKYFTVSRVLNAVLTGLSLVTGGAIAATDTLLAALGKLQKQISDNTTSLSGKLDSSSKDASGGVPGLTLFKLNLRNAANTFTSFFTTAATAARTWTLPDKDGTVAMITDITGTNSGTNTGDQTTVTGNSGTTSKLLTNDTRATDATPQSYSMGVTSDFKTNTTDGLTDGGSFHSIITIRQFTDWTGGGVRQLGFTDNGNMWVRNATADNAWSTWSRFTTTGANTFTGPQILSDQVVTRGMFKDMGVVFLDKGNSGTIAQTLDYTAGSHQKITTTGAFTLSTSNWPPTGNLGEIFFELTNGAAFAVTWPTINWVKSDGTFTTTFSTNGVTLQASGTDFILIWSRDGGTTLFGKIMR